VVIDPAGEGVPVLHRIVVGAVPIKLPFADPQIPSMA
jgi:hypothetical protein